MTIVVVSHGHDPDDLIACTQGLAPPRWPYAAMRTDWGAILMMGDAPRARVDDWLVIGVPQHDPWGFPGSESFARQLAERLCQFGPAALQLASGPFMGVRCSDGSVVAALNGLMSVYASPLSSWTASTSRRAIQRLDKVEPRRVPPGTFASPVDAWESYSAECDEDLSFVTWHGLDEELRTRHAALGHRSQAVLAESPRARLPEEAFVWSYQGSKEIAFVPRLAHLDHRPDGTAVYKHIRDEVVGRLWWRARLSGRWLCAPAFERPALDIALHARRGGRRGFRRGVQGS